MSYNDNSKNFITIFYYKKIKIKFLLLLLLLILLFLILLLLLLLLLFLTLNIYTKYFIISDKKYLNYK